MKIGFVGQGWVGKSYADDFESRGYYVVRYSLEPEYAGNKDWIAECDVVFIAVPTPTFANGQDLSAVRTALLQIGHHRVAVIKSTVLPGTTDQFQREFPDLCVLNSPEFLSEASAVDDAAHPARNIIGVARWANHAKAQDVLNLLPVAPFSQICTARAAELIKYAHNVHGYIQVVLTNLLYATAESTGADWRQIRKACLADPMMTHQYLNPVHKSGRGAGGNCFIKDFRAFADFYEREVRDKAGSDVLRSVEAKNVELLMQSGKDLERLEQCGLLEKVGR